MNNFKRLIGLTFVTTLVAGLALSAAIDGAHAKGHARESSGKASGPSRIESRTAIIARPAATSIKPAIKPAGSTRHAIVFKPDHGDGHHKHHRHHRHRFGFWLNDWADQQVYCDCRNRSCRKSGRCIVVCPSFSRCTIRPIVVAPIVSAPADASPFAGFDIYGD